MDQREIMVSVCMITYNHESYIAQAIEGVLMQKTNFQIELVIGEDCSGDKTREICKTYKEKYPDLCKLRLQDKNIGMMDNFIENLKSCTGKYIALCEGDDYWTDPLKLQKQVDFLEQNPDYGLIFTDADHLYEKTGKIISSYDKTYRRKIPVGNVLEELLYGNPYKTCSSLFKTKYVSDFCTISEKAQRHHFKMGDVILWLIIAGRSKIGYLPSSTVVYRVLGRSASHFNDIERTVFFGMSNYKRSIYFADFFHCPINRNKLKSGYRKYIISKCITDCHYWYLHHFLCYTHLIIYALVKEKLIRNLLPKIK